MHDWKKTGPPSILNVIRSRKGKGCSITYGTAKYPQGPYRWSRTSLFKFSHIFPVQIQIFVNPERRLTVLLRSKMGKRRKHWKTVKGSFHHEKNKVQSYIFCYGKNKLSGLVMGERRGSDDLWLHRRWGWFWVEGWFWVVLGGGVELGQFSIASPLTYIDR